MSGRAGVQLQTTGQWPGLGAHLAQHALPCNMDCHPLNHCHPLNPWQCASPAGICHTDYHQVNDEWGGGIFPMVPGHEIVGIVTEVGPKVKSLKPGDRVGVGCFVESCMKCDRYDSSHLVALTSARHDAVGAAICTLLCLKLQRAKCCFCSKPSQSEITLQRLSLQWLLVLLFCLFWYTWPHGTVRLCSKPGHFQTFLERLSLWWLLVPSRPEFSLATKQSLFCRCKKQEENYCPKCVLTYSAKDYQGEVTYGGYSTHLVVPEQ